MLFGEEGTNQADDGWPGGEDPDDVGAAPDLLVEPLLGVVGPDLGLVGFWEPGEGQDLGSGQVEVLGGGVEADLVEMVDDAAMLGPYLVGVGLGEDGAHHGGGHRLRRLGDLGQQVPQVVGALLAADHARILRQLRIEAAAVAAVETVVEERDLAVYDQITEVA